jgi:hypothetical protein
MGLTRSDHRDAQSDSDRSARPQCCRPQALRTSAVVSHRYVRQKLIFCVGEITKPIMAKIRWFATDCCNMTDSSQIFAFFALAQTLPSKSAECRCADETAIKIKGAF